MSPCMMGSRRGSHLLCRGKRYSGMKIRRSWLNKLFHQITHPLLKNFDECMRQIVLHSTQYARAFARLFSSKMPASIRDARPRSRRKDHRGSERRSSAPQNSSARNNSFDSANDFSNLLLTSTAPRCHDILQIFYNGRYGAQVYVGLLAARTQFHLIKN